MLPWRLALSLVHGPFVHRHQQIYDQLDRAGAARSWSGSATELGDTVVELLLPDRAADMALAGWEIVSEGAPQADQLIDMVQDCLDRAEYGLMRAPEFLEHRT